MNKIKKIFCDVDGTLLHSKNVLNDLYYSAKYKIPTHNIKQIVELENVEFNIASGRTDSNLQKFTQVLDNKVEYIISLNGSLVSQKGNIIFENKMDKEQAIQIAKYLDENNYFYFMFTSKGIFTGEKKIKNPIAKIVRKWVGVPINKDLKTAQELLKEDVVVYKFSVNFNIAWYNLNKHIDMFKTLFPKMYITESSNYSIDINANNISKGEIIRRICNQSNTQLNEIAVIGDSGNDMSMFELTDYSFCINHANKEIKNNCKYIVKNVAQALKIIQEINNYKDKQ